MTTRVKFEEFVIRKFEHLKKQRLNYDSKTNSYDDFYTDSAWAGWQACQDLNNAERESLLADIQTMREALEFYASKYGYSSTWDNSDTAHKMVDKGKVAKQALSTMPKLVEVGTYQGDVSDSQGVFDYCVYQGQPMVSGETKLYTIQKGE